MQRRGMDRRQNERSPDRLSDEELEYYGDLYIECNIREVGLDFESFLGNPDHYLRKYARERWRAGRDDGRNRRRGILGYLGLRPAAPSR
ncbi:MAG TPA: hypothetical protein VLT62_26120 [Candidatus Methylomirabilis sp.]|nr:hypothetical protein [Candidatus Methylomirabilis sp.]